MIFLCSFGNPDGFKVVSLDLNSALKEKKQKKKKISWKKKEENHSDNSVAHSGNKKRSLDVTSAVNHATFTQCKCGVNRT